MDQLAGSEVYGKRLRYLAEPYLQRLQSRVTGRKRDEKGLWYAFEQTIFYPQGGGQSADRGWISGGEVQDVQREADSVWHLLQQEIPAEVEMQLDWDSRYERMRQHTGQHVLSACFSRLFDIHTVSVHLGTEDTLVELNTNDLAVEKLQAAEEEANRIIIQNIPVQQSWIFKRDLGQYNLRRDIAVEEDPVRIIRIGEHDCTGCGGLHVARTAEIGLIKIVRTEKIRKHIRVQSKIGRPAYDFYTKLNNTNQQVCSLLSTEIDDLPQRVEQLLTEKRDLKKNLKTVSDKWLEAAAQNMQTTGNTGCFILTGLDRDQVVTLSLLWLEKNNRPCCICVRQEGRIDFTMRSPAGAKKSVLDFFKLHGREFALKGGGSAELVQGVIDPALLAAFNKKLEDFFKE
jgi:alanyl-tRNA synthetase